MFLTSIAEKIILKIATVSLRLEILLNDLIRIRRAKLSDALFLSSTTFTFLKLILLNRFGFNHTERWHNIARLRTLNLDQLFLKLHRDGRVVAAEIA